MRDEIELVKAHDLLVQVILGKCPNPWQDAEIRDLIQTCDVLCWVLRHDHNRTFAENLAGAYQNLKSMGLEQKEIYVQ